jgi:hypothetical protein
VTTNDQKTRVEPTANTYILNVPQAMDTVEHNIGIIKEPLSQIFKGS